jgi:TonB family protein
VPACRPLCAGHVEGDVDLEIVVDAKGSVTDARASRCRESWFDDAALAAVRAYRFAPAKRSGVRCP